MDFHYGLKRFEVFTWKVLAQVDEFTGRAHPHSFDGAVSVVPSFAGTPYAHMAYGPMLEFVDSAPGLRFVGEKIAQHDTSFCPRGRARQFPGIEQLSLGLRGRAVAFSRA